MSHETKRCVCCGNVRSIGEYIGPRGRQCKFCYREKNKQKHARYRATNSEYNLKANKRSAAWKKTDKGRKWHNEYQRQYNHTPVGSACVARFGAKHPDYMRRWYELHKEVLSLTRDSCLEWSDIPQVLIDVKREHVALKRKLNQQRSDP